MKTPVMTEGKLKSWL